MNIKQKIIDILLYSKSLQSLITDKKNKKSGYNVFKYESWGEEYPDKTFFVIRRENLWGIMSVITIYIQFIRYAIERNWIPVVDMQNVNNLYNQNDGQNSWEYFFEQPMKYTMNDIRNAKNIVISGTFVYYPKKKSYCIDYLCLTNKNIVNPYQVLANEYYLLKPDVKLYIEKLEKEIFKDIKQNEVIACYSRGTDYIDLKPKNHPIQPTPQQIIDKVKEIQSNTKIQYVYLVTEDIRVLETFKNEFGDKLLYNPYASRWGAAKDDEDYIFKRELSVSKRENGISYLTNMMLCSHASHFVGGITGGSAGFLLLNKTNFDSIYLFNLGRY